MTKSEKEVEDLATKVINSMNELTNSSFFEEYTYVTDWENITDAIDIYEDAITITSKEYGITVKYSSDKSFNITKTIKF